MPPKKSSDSANKTLEETNLAILKRLESIDNKFDLLNTRLIETNNIAMQAYQKAEEAHTLATECLANNAEADQAIRLVEQETITSNERIKELEAKLEDQINRSMRSTLVFKGVPGNEPSWTKTTETLSNLIHEIQPEIPCEVADSWIERAHRVKSKNGQKESLNIIAKFTSWKNSETVKDLFIQHNKKNKNSDTPKIYVEQLQSKLLAARSNEAKKFRKKLKEENPNWLLYVAHPAKLLCKKPGELKYIVLSEF